MWMIQNELCYGLMYILQRVENYFYLIRLRNKDNLTAELNRRIRLAWAVYNNKPYYMLKNRGIPQHFRTRIFCIYILVLTFYGGTLRPRKFSKRNTGTVNSRHVTERHLH